MMSKMSSLYTDEFLEKVKSSIPDFEDFYKDLSEGRVGFSFKDRAIELSTDYAEKTDPYFLTLLLKTFNKPDNTADEFSLPATTDTRAIIHTWVEDIKENHIDQPDVKKEKDAAQRALNSAHMLTLQHTKQEDSFLPVSKTQAQYLQAIMKSFEAKEATYPSKQEINKQGETLFVRDIMSGSKVVGEIKYLETDSQVTIIRSDIDTPFHGKGLATVAYSSFIDEKLSQGKVVNSDSIVSLKAQGIYKRLEEQGYTVMKQPSRRKYREDLTTLLPDNIRSQQATFPTIVKEGVGMTEDGYRLKGAPVYSVVKSPNVSLDNSPIELAIIDNKTKHEKTFQISPNKVSLSEQQNQSLSALNTHLHKDIEKALEVARNNLQHKDNREIRSRLTTENIGVWKVQTTEASEMARALSKNHELGASYER